MKKYILFAGVNGAGKSTLYQVLESIKDMPRVNTDEIVRSIGTWTNTQDVYTAGKMAVNLIQTYFSEGVSFNQETTLCGGSILRNIDKAKSLGYTIEMHYVGVNSADIAKQRIRHRMKVGGHGIPDEDVERRFVETFMNLKKVLKKCDTVVLYDNTEEFKRFAVYQNGECVSIGDDVPEWYTKYVSIDDLVD